MESAVILLRGDIKAEHALTRDPHSTYHKLLSNQQEEALLQYIEELNQRGIPPTAQIENLVVKLIKKPIGKHWIYRFCKRYKKRLQSRYLQAIDQSRYLADNSRHFETYFEIVSPIPLFQP
jgi:hypothetical protein